MIQIPRALTDGRDQFAVFESLLEVLSQVRIGYGRQHRPQGGQKDLREAQHGFKAHIGSRLVGEGERDLVVEAPKILKVLLVLGSGAHLFAYVVDQLANGDGLVLVGIRSSIETLQHKASERAVSTTKLRPFLGLLRTTAGH